MPTNQIVSAITSSLLITPIMTLLDMSILQSQMNKEKLSTSFIKNLQYYTNSKKQFIKPGSIMFGIYSLTYSTANLTELYCINNNVDYKLPVLINTSVVNIVSINYKDYMYSKLLDSKQKKYNASVNVLFALRDLTTMACNFVFKKDAVKLLENHVSYGKAELIASFLVPSVAQVVNTPIHILAIDMFNNPKLSLAQRCKNIRASYNTVLFGRMLRTIPAFCIGGFVNDMLRYQKWD